MAHRLRTLCQEVDKTHPQLGKPIAAALLVCKAKRTLFIISPHGCGKSRISSFIGEISEEKSLQDRLSVAGLGELKEEFNNFGGVLVVDDIAKTQTQYARITTLCTIAELVYSHYCKSHLYGSSYEIENFTGSAIVNIQPVLLKEAIKSPEWEASIQDKSIRYYHLHRPLEPNPEPPKVTIENSTDIQSVKKPKLTGKYAEELLEIGNVQWSWSRVKEHSIELLRAAAALDGRKTVNQTDYKIVVELLNPLRVEQLVTRKSNFESERDLDAEELAILTEFTTYGMFTLKDLSRDYKLSESQCYRIMKSHADKWEIIGKSPTRYAPTKELKTELRRLNLYGE